MDNFNWWTASEIVTGKSVSNQAAIFFQIIIMEIDLRFLYFRNSRLIVYLIVIVRGYGSMHMQAWFNIVKEL